MLKLPMDAIKNCHGCSQQCSHKISGKYVSCTHLWILTAIASICVTSWGPCWLGATCKNVFHASSVKKMYCIDLQLPCQGSKSQAFGSCVKNNCVVQRLQRFQDTLMKILFCRLKKFFIGCRCMVIPTINC